MITSTGSVTGAGTPPPQCPTVEDQLAKVTNEIIRFQARKLDEAKTELEAVKKKKDAAKADYSKQFEGLRKTWCEQNDHIISMRRDLIGAFPKYKELIKQCICAKLSETQTQEVRIACRSEVKGTRETARDNAMAARDAAKASAAAWENAAKGINDQLTANAALIDKLCKLACTPDRVTALYQFWMQLLPAHACLRPITDCFDVVPADEMPKALCPPPAADGTGRSCAQYEEKPEDVAAGIAASSATTSGDTAPAASGMEGKAAPGTAGSSGTPTDQASSDQTDGSQGVTARWPRCDPWLIPPDQYPGKIDCAYDAYLKAKDAYAAAEAYFQKKPDDLKTVKANLEALKKTLEASITECLRSTKDKGCCEQEDASKQTAAATGAAKAQGA